MVYLTWLFWDRKQYKREADLPELVLMNDQQWHGQLINSVRTLWIPKPALSVKNGTDA
jgi:hypothetical protein